MKRYLTQNDNHSSDKKAKVTEIKLGRFAECHERSEGFCHIWVC